MLHPQSPWPPEPERPERLAEALREQGATPDELEALVPVVRRLTEWQAPQPAPADTQRLLARITPELPALSPVRQAIRARQQREGLSWLLATARTQISLFGPAFWLVSALLTLLGAVVVLSTALPDEERLLRASGPFLAYLGTIIAFRGTAARTLECELVCLPSPVQLALARLVIVLGYDVGLGLALSLALWAGGSSQVLALTLSWLMPLLLVAGLALLLSLRLSIQAAASVAYGSWLALLAINVTWGIQILPLAPLSESLLGVIGVALLAVALLRLQPGMHRLLPMP
jgi:hypothetical protein